MVGVCSPFLYNDWCGSTCRKIPECFTISCGKVLSAKKILIEISVLYVLIYILSHIPYTINILPISKITEKDIFVAFGPFIILYLSWIGILLLRKKNIG